MMKRRLSTFGKSLRTFFDSRRRESRQLKREELQDQLAEAAAHELPPSAPATATEAHFRVPELPLDVQPDLPHQLAEEAAHTPKDQAVDSSSKSPVGSPLSPSPSGPGPDHAESATGQALTTAIDAKIEPAPISDRGDVGVVKTELSEAKSNEGEVAITFDEGLHSCQTQKSPVTYEFCTFDSDDPEDFTYGPTRFIEATDGQREVVALCITHELSHAITVALQQERAYRKVVDDSYARKDSVEWLKGDTESQIARCIAQIDSAGEGSQAAEGAAADGAVSQQLEVLKLFIKELETRKQEIDAGVETKASMLQQAHTQVSIHLNSVYVQAKLLEPLADEEPAVAERLDFNAEYQNFLARLQEAEEPLIEVDDVAPLEAIGDHLQSEPPSEETQIRDEAWSQYLQARDRFYEAQTEFDLRSERRREEFSQLLIPADSDEEARHTTREDLDLRWVHRDREITRALIDAEGMVLEARRRARELDVDLADDDISSIFAEYAGGDHGYTLSEERDMIAAVGTSSRLKAWVDETKNAPSPTAGAALDHTALNGIPSVSSPSSPIVPNRLSEDEGWDASEVDAEDSCSIAAEGRRRTRIDQYRRQWERSDEDAEPVVLGSVTMFDNLVSGK